MQLKVYNVERELNHQKPGIFQRCNHSPSKELREECVKLGDFVIVCVCVCVCVYVCVEWGGRKGDSEGILNCQSRHALIPSMSMYFCLFVYLLVYIQISND